MTIGETDCVGLVVCRFTATGVVLPACFTLEASLPEMFLGLGGTFRVGTGLLSSVLGRVVLVSTGGRLAAVAGLGGSDFEGFAAAVGALVVVLVATGFLMGAFVEVCPASFLAAATVVVVVLDGCNDVERAVEGAEAVLEAAGFVVEVVVGLAEAAVV